MKKFIGVIFALVSAVALSLGLAACSGNGGNEGGGNGGGDDKGTRYSIQAPQNSDVYTVTGLPDGAYEDDKVTFKVVLSDPENSVLSEVGVEPSTSAYYALSGADDGTYSFTMPAEPVKIVIDARAFEEVLSDGGVTFVSDNAREIAVNSGNTKVWDEDNNLVDRWAFDISLGWRNTAAFSSNSKVTSSDETVIPSDAVTIKEGDKGNNFYFTSAEILIDTSKINPGKTWLEIYLQSNNSSTSRGTVCVQITVTAEGTVTEVEKWTETVVFTLSSGIDTEDLYFCFTDTDYGSNMDSQERQYFYAGEYEISDDDTVTLTIEYVKGHKYRVTAGINDGSGNSLELNESVTSGAAYQDDALTFERTGVTIEITVRNEFWRP